MSSLDKDTQRAQIAERLFAARAAGVLLHGVAIAHIDSKWVYPGGGD